VENPLAAVFVPALQARLLLVLNHVVQAEPVAVARLTRHAGRSVALDWNVEPGPWPRPPALRLRVTAAGLFESCGPVAAGEAQDPADLSVRIELPAPHRLAAQWLEGRRPAVAVEGDAQLAADVAWLGDNLRWDVAQDLSRIVGAGPAHQIVRAAQSFAAALRDLARRSSGAWGGGSPPQASK
jgi:ubiquinone biosynthesis protein UbiJ